MNLQEKIASVPKLERIDSSIESCLKIIRQELIKRESEDPFCDIYGTLDHLFDVEVHFNVMRNKHNNQDRLL